MILKFGSFLIVLIGTAIILGYFAVKVIKPVKLSDGEIEKVLAEFLNSLPD